MKTPEISIIVPVYQVEKYLPRCLNSILMQTFADFELILVDDGSTDNSGVICDIYAEKDKRIRVFHQQNTGVSSARNVGIDVAQGKYIGFVDADDWVDTEMLKELHDVINNNKCEMIIFDPYVYKGDINSVIIDSLPSYSSSQCIYKNNIIPEQLRYLAGTVWRCLYSADLINANKIRFNCSLPLSEDRIFNITAMGCSENIYYLRKPLYHYWIYKNSSVSKYRENLFDIVLYTQKIMSEVLLKYWDKNYILYYEEVNLCNGALLCVYNAFSKYSTLSFYKRFHIVKSIVDNQTIRKAFDNSSKKNLRYWLVRKKCYLILSIVGVLWNIKNR